MKRRQFINQIGAGTAASFLPSTLLSFTTSISSNTNRKDLKIGIVTDVHKDLMPDADRRLEVFIKQAVDRNVDFIIQMGDFCMADKKTTIF